MMASAGSQRHLGRERAVQALFFLENVEALAVQQGLADFWSSLDEPTPKQAARFAEELVVGVMEHLAELDGAVQEQSESWRIERMAKVDRNVLRLAAYELLFTDTPARVIINEAIEIARTFGAEGSPAFVNGILDKLAKARGKL